MIPWKKLSAGAALTAGLALSAALPAEAAGDTARAHGCAAHWRVTASWNECTNAPGVNVQLQVDCSGIGPAGYTSDWVFVRGAKDPVRRYECFQRVSSAWNAFRF